MDHRGVYDALNREGLLSTEFDFKGALSKLVTNSPGLERLVKSSVDRALRSAKIFDELSKIDHTLTYLIVKPDRELYVGKRTSMRSLPFVSQKAKRVFGLFADRKFKLFPEIDDAPKDKQIELKKCQETLRRIEEKDRASRNRRAPMRRFAGGDYDYKSYRLDLVDRGSYKASRPLDEFRESYRDPDFKNMNGEINSARLSIYATSSDQCSKT